MTTFKQGDRFIPRKERATNGYRLGWSKEMDEFDGKILTVKVGDNSSYIQAEETGYYFHPHWCERVEEIVNN